MHYTTVQQTPPDHHGTYELATEAIVTEAEKLRRGQRAGRAHHRSHVRSRSPLVELEVSKSPRSTWVWAPGEASAAEVRAALEAAGHSWYRAEGRGSESRVTDIDIGGAAMDALAALASAGYTLRWHAVEAAGQPGDHLYGVPVAPAITD